MRKNIIHGLLGHLAFQLGQAGILIIVARLASPESVGQLTLAAALVTPVFFIFTIWMRLGYSIDSLNTYTLADYFALRILSGVAAVIVIVSIVWGFYSDASASTISTIFAFALLKLVGTQSNLAYGVFQRNERLDYVTASTLTRSILGLTVFGLVFYFTRNLTFSFLGEAIAWSLAIILVDLNLLKRCGVTTREVFALKFNIKKAIQLFWWMLPLGMSGFIINLIMSAPRTLIEMQLGLAALGVFGVIAYLQAALSAVAQALGSATAPRFARLHKNHEPRRFLNLTLKVLALSAAIVAFIIPIAYFFGEVGLALVFGNEYAQLDLLMLITYSASLQILAAPFNFAIAAGHYFRSQLISNALGLFVVVVSCIQLIPEFGVIGAGYATLFGALIRLVCLAIAYTILFKNLKRTQDAKKDNAS